MGEVRKRKVSSEGSSEKSNGSTPEVKIVEKRYTKFFSFYHGFATICIFGGFLPNFAKVPGKFLGEIGKMATFHRLIAIFIPFLPPEGFRIVAIFAHFLPFSPWFHPILLNFDPLRDFQRLGRIMGARTACPSVRLDPGWSVPIVARSGDPWLVSKLAKLFGQMFLAVVLVWFPLFLFLLFWLDPVVMSSRKIPKKILMN